MLTFDLQGLNKARIWLQSNNDLLIDNDSNERHCKFEGNELKAHIDRTIILELFLPRGARIIYGALGVNYIHSMDKKLFAKIHTTSINRKIFKESLIAPVEQPHVGLKKEYSEGILSQLKELHKINKLLLGGELDFVYAVYGGVSSSSWIFQKLTYMLVSLILLPQDNINREILIELLEQSQTKTLALD